MATAIKFPASCAACPTCGRKFTSPKTSDKKLAQDMARAEAAILVLQNYPADNAALREACESELLRLQAALTDHSLLWSIYRRSDKASGYGIAVVR